MSKKIDVYSIAEEIHEKAYETYKKALLESSVKAQDSENPFASKYVEDFEALRTHLERFTVTLVQRVVDELIEKK